MATRVTTTTKIPRTVQRPRHTLRQYSRRWTSFWDSSTGATGCIVLSRLVSARSAGGGAVLENPPRHDDDVVRQKRDVLFVSVLDRLQIDHSLLLDGSGARPEKLD